MPSSWLFALLGGALIGVAGALLFFTHGRIAGISGIYGSLLSPSTRDRDWRIAFLVGLGLAGVIGGMVSPTLVGASVRPLPVVIVAGLLVGYGTRLGSGCTSGHGVCGLARFSLRSLVATTTFLGAAIVTVWLVRHVGGLAV